MEQDWKSIWEKDATHNNKAQLIVNLKADHSNLPEQGPVVITGKGLQYVDMNSTWS